MIFATSSGQLVRLHAQEEDKTIKLLSGDQVVGFLKYLVLKTELYVLDLKNCTDKGDKIKGLGSYLIELAAHKTTLPLTLTTGEDSHFFYWKMGFRLHVANTLKYGYGKPEVIEKELNDHFEAAKGNEKKLRTIASKLHGYELMLDADKLVEIKARSVGRAFLNSFAFNIQSLIYEFWKDHVASN